MKALLNGLRLFFFFFCWYSSWGEVYGQSFVPANHPDIAYIGRISFADPQSPCFTFPGAQIRAMFDGPFLSMQVKPNSGYFMVEIDDRQPFKVGAGTNDSILVLADGLCDTVHSVVITLAYEGWIRRPEFRGFGVAQGRGLRGKPALPSRRIEFIGNSITCGYGVETNNPRAPFQDETENHYYSYAAFAARALKAQSLVVARSGIGIYRNYADPEAGSPGRCMPDVYPYTLFGDRTEKWDFSLYQPDVVCINLGTNDVNTSSYDRHLLENGYRRFLKTLREHYPMAKIVFLTGPMLRGGLLREVKETLNKIVEETQTLGDRNVFRFDLTPTDGTLGYGASWHPSRLQQEKSGKELAAYLRGLMDW